MRIVARHSHLGGLEHLRIRSPFIWREIESVVARTDKETERASGPWHEARTADFGLQGEMGKWLLSRDWNPLHRARGSQFIKERVAVRVQFGEDSSFGADLWSDDLAFFVRDVIDVGVEIVPMKELQEQMSSGVPYYEGELYNLIREGRGVPAVPLVLIGVAP
jgi:hypothetical protein